jgi:hypothetical protein
MIAISLIIFQELIGQCYIKLHILVIYINWFSIKYMESIMNLSVLDHVCPQQTLLCCATNF